MKGNSISVKPLNESGKTWLEKTLQLMKVQEYGKGSVRNYMQELTLLFKHYNDLEVEALRQKHIERYLIFIKENHKVGRAKCRSVAQACSFFFKNVMPADYIIVPSNLFHLASAHTFRTLASVLFSGRTTQRISVHQSSNQTGFACKEYAGDSQ